MLLSTAQTDPDRSQFSHPFPWNYVACLYKRTSSLIYVLQPEKWRQHIPPEYWYPPTTTYGITAQKTIV
jgi:hypothetical protein